MSAAGLYPLLKAFHVAAALLFVAGVIAAGVFLRFHVEASARNVANAEAFRRWDRRVTLPAMLVVWVLGVELAVTGHWIGARWLIVKVCLVILLSAVHGVQSGQVRRLSRGAAVRAVGTTRWVLGAILGIAILVVVKPF